MDETIFNFKDFFELSPDLLIISTYDGFYKKVNSAVINTFGYSEEELFSHPINYFVHPEDRENTSAIRSRLREKETVFNFENRYVTKNGDTIWLAWTSKASEKDELIYSIAKDITYKKTIEINRNLLISDLKEENQSYKKLTYTTAHDLRSPVDSLLSIFKLLDISTIKDEKNKKLMELLRRGSEQLRAKLNNYIDDLGKNQKVKVALEEVRFQETFNAVTKAIKNLIKTSNAKIETNFSAADTISFNNDYLYSIFLNLISNAIKYAKPNAKPELTIYSEKQDDVILLYFVDNGIGIDLNKSKGKIFGLHQTFHGLDKDSKGIGLYLVHTHITSFGGSINVESTLGKGTKFILSFNQKFI